MIYHILDWNYMVDIEKLNTKNLLAFYRAERKRFYSAYYSRRCGCCGMFEWEISSKSYPTAEKEYDNHKQYLDSIKRVLNNREHINRKR